MSVKGSEKDGRQKSEAGSKKVKVHRTRSSVCSKNIFNEEVKVLKSKNLLRKLTCIEASSGSKINIDGQSYINLSSNDYLNLSAHPRIVRSAIAALKKYGFGSGASRLLSGTYLPHQALEDKIAEFKGTQSAILYNTGYAANTGVIPALAGMDTVIFSDELNHASIIDGIRLSRGEVFVYRHRDMDHLETTVRKSFQRKSIKRRLVVTDTVFSMDGDIAPLADIYSLCRKYDLMLMIDDAHGTGVIGKNGRGGLEHFDLKQDDIIQMGTLSKAFGCFGAFVAGERSLIDFLVSSSRSFIYSTSLPPSAAAAAVTAVEIVQNSSFNLRKKLWNNRQMLFEGLNNMGLDTLSSETPVIPVLAGETKEALRISKYLFNNKIFAPAIRPPTVPEGKCRVRFSVTAAHTNEDIYSVLKCLREIV